MSNEENMIGEIAYYSPLGLSDHSVLVFDYHCYLKPENISRMKYYLDKGDYNAMRQDMSIDWDSACDGCEHNIDSMWLLFINKLNDAKNKHIPHKLIGGRPPWGDKGKFPIHEKVRKEIRKKHRCWEKAYTDKTESAKKKYNQQRNKVRKLTRKLYKDYEKKIAKEAKSNPKRFWQYAKSKTKTSSTIAQLQVAPDNDELTTNDTEKAELLQKYFSSVFTREPPEDIPTVTEHNAQSQLNCLTVSEKQVFDKLSKLDISKSAGPDDIQPRILRELANTLPVPLAKIFNFSLRTSTLPTDWKMGNITAIFKKGQRKLPSNYRPISLTSIVCKVLESLVRDAIIKHFKDNLLFSSNQFGFISGRSTTLQLLHVLETWSEILDRGGNIDCIYMDFMKAFDTVSHERLLSKIQSYCISDQLLGWISSFLSDRQQRVCINGCHSNWGSVTSGIPQGSVLGPILFVIYINDLPEMVNNSTVYLFADDTKIFKEISCFADIDDVQEDLTALQEWSDKWLLRFHPDKCVALSLGKTKEDAHQYFLTKDNKDFQLKNVNQETDLGITVDSSLSFDQHVQAKVNKANSITGLIRRTFNYLDEENILMLYKALVRPHLEYGNAVWHPHKVEHITAIGNVQRRITKLIPTLKDLPYSDRLKRLRLPTLAYRRLRGDMIETYKIFNTYDTAATLNLQRNSSTTRGHQYKLCLGRSQRDIGKFRFSNRIVSPWNSLPPDVVEASNVKIFESRLDKLWRKEDIIYDYRPPPPGKIRQMELNTEAHGPEFRIYPEVSWGYNYINRERLITVFENVIEIICITLYVLHSATIFSNIKSVWRYGSPIGDTELPSGRSPL